MPPGHPFVERLEDRALLSVVGGGFAESVVAPGLKRPTAFALTRTLNSPILVAEQGGGIRLIQGGALQNAPLVTLPVDTAGDRGVLGIALDPAYSRTRYAYVSYTMARPEPHQRVSKFFVAGDRIDLNTEIVLLDLPAWSDATTNLGGGLAFGNDDKLYVGVGVGDQKDRAGDTNSPFGKVLRVNRDGTAPAANPYAGQGEWARFVWTWGLRDPSSVAVQPENGITYVTDGGESKFEEVNVGKAGIDYGYPKLDGPISPTDTGPGTPIHAYPHASDDPGVFTGSSISAGHFFNPGTLTFPVPFGGDYFFADRDAGSVRVINLEKFVPDAQAESFAEGVAAPVGLGSTAEGDLLILARGTGGTDGHIIRLRPTGEPAVVKHPKSVAVAAGTSVTLSVEAAGEGPLTYQWTRGGNVIPGATGPTWITGTLLSADDLSSYQVTVTNKRGSAVSRVAVVHVTGPDPVGGGGTDPGTNPGTDPGTNPGTDPGTTPGGNDPRPGGGGTAKPTRPEPGTTDLYAYLSARTKPQIVAGTRGKATVKAYNFGQSTLFGPLKVRLYLSADGQVDVTDTLLAEVERDVKIKPNAKKAFNLKFAYASPTDGPQQLLVQLDPGNEFVESDETNNTAVGGGPVHVAEAFTDVRTLIGATPATATPGRKTAVPVTVYNDGNVATTGTMTVAVYATAVGATADAVAALTPIYSATVKLKLSPGKGKAVKLKFAFPTDLAAGTYAFAATATGAELETDASNNASVGSAAFTVSS